MSKNRPTWCDVVADKDHMMACKQKFTANHGTTYIYFHGRDLETKVTDEDFWIDVSFLLTPST